MTESGIKEISRKFCNKEEDIIIKIKENDEMWYCWCNSISSSFQQYLTPIVVAMESWLKVIGEWTREHVIFLFKEKVKQLGRIPTTKEINNDPLMPSHSTFSRKVLRKRNAPYIKAVNSLGYAHHIKRYVHNLPKKRSKEEEAKIIAQCKQQIQRFLQKKSRLPYTHELNDLIGFSHLSFIRLVTKKPTYQSLKIAYARCGFDVSGWANRKKNSRRTHKEELDRFSVDDALKILDSGSSISAYMKNKPMATVTMILKYYGTYEYFFINKLHITTGDYRILLLFSQHFRISFSTIYDLVFRPKKFKNCVLNGTLELTNRVQRRRKYLRYNYQKNIAKLIEQVRKLPQKDEVKLRERRRRYRVQNKDKIKEYNRRYREKNKDKIKEYRQKNKKDRKA